MSGQPVDKVEFIKENGYYMSTPQGSSMRPFIRGGRDSVMMKAADGEIKKYDVVLYPVKSGHFVMHRVLGIKDGVCRIRGDNCFYEERVPRESIVAVMDRLIRDGKKEIRQTKPLLFLVGCWRLAYPARYCLYRVKKKISAVMRKKK